MKARDVMTSSVVSVTPDCSIGDLATRLQRYRISGMPVINAGGALVGIVTEGDCLRRAETGTETKRSGWRSFLRLLKPLPRNMSALMDERLLR